MVPPENESALALAIERLIEDVALRKRLGSAARKHIEVSYSLDYIAQRYLHLMDGQ
jgi:glycosyltransferase involved in cell wall biosynthesis